MAVVAVLVVVGFAVPVHVMSCGTDAVGIEACRTIEYARCDAAANCGFSDTDVSDCKDYYRDQCLHGIENADHIPEDQEIQECVDAIAVVAACAQNDVVSMEECSSVTLVEGTDAAVLSPCEVVEKSTELLSACSFVVATEETTSSEAVSSSDVSTSTASETASVE